MAALIPKLALWYDVDASEGAYIETGLDLRVPILPVANIYLGALAGWSAGQGVNGSEPSQLAHFQTDGLTHLDLSAAASFWVWKGFSLAPALHVQFGEDAATQRTGADDSADLKVWFALALSWAHELGASP